MNFSICVTQHQNASSSTPLQGVFEPLKPRLSQTISMKPTVGEFRYLSHPRLMLNPKFYCVPLVCKDSMHEKGGGIQTTIRGKVACNGTSDVLKSAICCSYTHTARADAHPPHKKRFFSSTSCTRHVDARGAFILNIFQKRNMKVNNLQRCRRSGRLRPIIHQRGCSECSGCTDFAVGAKNTNNLRSWTFLGQWPST